MTLQESILRERARTCKLELGITDEGYLRAELRRLQVANLELESRVLNAPHDKRFDDYEVWRTESV